MKPLVSICIPAYNAERFIAATVESALAQDYPNIEIIVSDDCSTDQTVAIVEKFLSRGVHLVKQPKNLGMHANWNAVIRASSGKYILKLDADDLIEPEHVSEQVKVMEKHPEVTFAHCACHLIDVNGEHIGYERSIHGSFIRTGTEEWPRYVFGPRAVNIVMIRRTAFDQVGGYDERYKYSGDWAMHRALLKIGSVYYNDHVIASYRVHSVGKEGVRLLQAKEHLMHLEDMTKNWPVAVPNKGTLIKQAKKHFAMKSLMTAANCPREERMDILDTVPKYTDDWQVRLISSLFGLGLIQPIKLYLAFYLWLRLRIKSIIFQVQKKGQPQNLNNSATSEWIL